jgi:hypothetical protein
MTQERKTIHLRTATMSQLIEVPVIEFLDFFMDLAKLWGAAICAGIGTHSPAIGASVLLGLSLLLRHVKKKDEYDD